MLSNHINVRYYNHGLNDPFLPRVTSNFGASVGGPPHNMSALCVLSVQALVFLRRRAHGRRLAATGSSHRSVSLLSAPHTSSSETWPLKCLRRIEEESPFLSGVRSGGETPRLPPCWFLSAGYDIATARVCFPTCPPITALWSALSKSRYECHILHELLHEHLSGSVHLLPSSLPLWSHALHFNVHTASCYVLYSCHGNWW